ncbi:MAG: lysophospholipid acyltransferase family protein [Halothermotrichaceae bacterium]
MKNIILYNIFLIFITILKILPLKICKKVGRGVGIIIYHLARGRNKVIRTNLRKAFPEKSEQECEELLQDVYINFGLVLIEVMLMERFTIDEINDCLSVQGVEYFNKLSDTEDGIILYTAHFGNWEWLGTYFASRGHPVSAIVTKQSNSYFNKKINEIRRSIGAKITTKDLSLRKIYKRLLKGEILYILGDQDGGENGWNTIFFGRETSTFTGPVRFAAATGSYILPVFIIREGWLKHKIKFYPPYLIEKNASRQQEKELLQELTTLTESVIREYPDQWFWLHKRWKSSNS